MRFICVIVCKKQNEPIKKIKYIITHYMPAFYGGLCQAPATRQAGYYGHFK